MVGTVWPGGGGLGHRALDEGQFRNNFCLVFRVFFLWISIIDVCEIIFKQIYTKIEEKTVKNRYFSKIKSQISQNYLLFLRNLDFCTPNLVYDGSYGFLSKGDNFLWEKIPKSDHSSNIRIVFSCLVLGKSSKIALFNTFVWISRYFADIGPFLTANRKVR